MGNQENYENKLEVISTIEESQMFCLSESPQSLLFFFGFRSNSMNQ